MSIKNATTHQPSANQSKFQSKGAARPEGAADLEEGQFCNDDFHVIATKHGWTMGSYTNSDGSTGFILSNGQSMFHFDINGNIVLATGKPGQSGCGGKVVIHSNNHHESTGSYNLHVKGNDEESEKEGSAATGDVKSTPAYSIYVEGDVAIESQGGDVGLKGDNITINAINNLILRAGENINLESGEGQGKITAIATDVNVDSSFTRFTTSGGFYVEGSGEFEVNQKDKVGASASINTKGDINHVVSGKYSLKTRGDYTVESETGHLLFKASRGGIATDVKGKSYESVGGTKETKILGKSTSAKGQQDPAYKIDIGASQKGSLDIKGASYFNAKFVGKSAFDSTTLDIKAKGALKMNGKSIFLN